MSKVIKCVQIGGVNINPQKRAGIELDYTKEQASLLENIFHFFSSLLNSNCLSVFVQLKIMINSYLKHVPLLKLYFLSRLLGGLT